MSIYYRDDTVTLHVGDAATVLAGLEADSAGCIVTSPPYYGLRDYGTAGQIGAEPTPAEYVAALVDVFRQARRVLTRDGTLWLNLGDAYAAPTGQGRRGQHRPSGRRDRATIPAPASARFDRPPKSLLGMPWRVAFALQDDGWILRNAIVWHKPNAMPESVTDRLSSRYELVFLLTKHARRYHFDLDAIRPALGGNPGDVWHQANQPFTGAHIATMPVALAERCIAAGSKPTDTILDPFSGTATTGLAAARHDRRYIGIDINAAYHDLALRTRLAQTTLALADAH